ncbi:hypothetical protein XO10_08895 [Marinitoga sp. 1135]|uniref:Uncharacterized protein n=1 Tax=Marinitoga piezophila (strain DSM 14283 / JCM 11233 / KA3) TaxID=443254 RepID=H2J5W4_MARPK|nr:MULTISPECIES: hypothetical protein [Marinitoga]AEX86183.1 hypothetical protein Marpi_1802 [Marinitoga piezophila KA3]APT76597.1 hypothetical protein LN42_09575 [Marinitoga sp. 1137]NUU96372.1 hypothetical protein [Marinitoga sp. 1135]NUU98293.1 hypothetical protein [Marinitoga sp. 1138]
MRKGFLFVVLILLGTMVFPETYYVIGNTVFRGSLLDSSNQYEVTVVSPENDLTGFSDKRIIVIDDNVKELLNQYYLVNGNDMAKQAVKKGDITVNGNIVPESANMNLKTIYHEFKFFMPKDYSLWKIGGRREDENKNELSSLNNTVWYRIHKNGFSENNLYKDFELPYCEDTHVEFYAEIAGLVTKGKNLDQKAYSVAGIIFAFLDENKNTLDKIAFVWSSSDYPFKEYLWINPMPLKNSTDFRVKFNVNDLAYKKQIKYLRVIFWTFGSSHSKTLNADLWIRNIRLVVAKEK